MFNLFYYSENNQGYHPSSQLTKGLSSVYYSTLSQSAKNLHNSLINPQLQTKIDIIRDSVQVNVLNNGLYYASIKSTDNEGTNYQQNFVNAFNDILKDHCAWNVTERGNPIKFKTSEDASGGTLVLFFIQQNDWLEIKNRLISFFLDTGQELLIHEVMQTEKNLLDINIIVEQ